MQEDLENTFRQHTVGRCVRTSPAVTADGTARSPTRAGGGQEGRGAAAVGLAPLGQRRGELPANEYAGARVRFHAARCNCGAHGADCHCSLQSRSTPASSCRTTSWRRSSTRKCVARVCAAVARRRASHRTARAQADEDGAETADRQGVQRSAKVRLRSANNCWWLTHARLQRRFMGRQPMPIIAAMLRAFHELLQARDAGALARSAWQ
jgi:hypothetical protein